MPQIPPPPEFDAAPADFEGLLRAALVRIREHEHDPAGFLAWFRTHAPDAAPSMFDAMPADARATAAYWLGFSIWNATPLASNRYRPRPLPRPERNRACPCGSGRKFKHCCVHALDLLDLDADWAWSLLAEVVPEKVWLEESRQGRLPVEAKLHLAAYFEDEGRWRAIMRLLEGDLLHGGADLDPRLGDLVDLLCNAYDATYRSDRKKVALLTHLARHPVAHIRAEANQRLGAWLADQGEHDRAWDALRESMRADPDNPGAALLELNLLYNRGDLDLLKQRAEFWYRRLARRSDATPELTGLLDGVRKDPVAAFEALQQDRADPEFAALVSIIERAVTRTRPDYAYRSIRHVPGPEGSRGCELVPDEASARAASAWAAVCPIDKPFSTQWLPAEDAPAWQHTGRWLAFLRDTPTAFDSIDVIDDVVTLLLAHPDADSQWVTRVALRPLLERALAIIVAARRDVTSTATLPWLLESNRPALRLVSRLIAIGEHDAAPATQVTLMQHYLALNPDDNHGWRGVLVSILLRGGRDAEALAVIERYPGDATADLVYGRVLALFRMGEKGRALLALIEAREWLPNVFSFLLRDSVKPPRLYEGGYALGGKDQAWLYREAMRDVWVATPGLLDWMKALPKLRR